MRGIKFRGKISTVDSWVYGHYAYVDGYHVIYENGKPFIIKLNTLGQFTGIADRKGVDIFEGDIVKVWYLDQGEEQQEVIQVRWSSASASFTPWNWEHSCDGCDLSTELDEIKVIGNIYENRDLLELQ